MDDTIADAVLRIADALERLVELVEEQAGDEDDYGEPEPHDLGEVVSLDRVDVPDTL